MHTQSHLQPQILTGVTAAGLGSCLVCMQAKMHASERLVHDLVCSQQERNKTYEDQIKVQTTSTACRCLDTLLMPFLLLVPGLVLQRIASDRKA